MATHPLWRPFEQVDLEEIDQFYVSGKAPQQETIEVVPPDPSWPAMYDELAGRIREALGERVLGLEHVGSTSVPGLWAKPVIDLDLTVADSADEAAYVPALEEAGFVLTVREPEWEEHRCFRAPTPRANLHVWSPVVVEARRHAAFRDWLTTHEADRTAYADLKRDLAGREFATVMAYNNEKAALIYDIYERVFSADGSAAHTPQPRDRGDAVSSG